MALAVGLASGSNSISRGASHHHHPLHHRKATKGGGGRQSLLHLSPSTCWKLTLVVVVVWLPISIVLHRWHANPIIITNNSREEGVGILHAQPVHMVKASVRTGLGFGAESISSQQIHATLTRAGESKLAREGKGDRDEEKGKLISRAALHLKHTKPVDDFVPLPQDETEEGTFVRVSLSTCLHFHLIQV